MIILRNDNLAVAGDFSVGERKDFFFCFMANMQCTALAGWRKPSLEIFTVMQKTVEIEVHLHFQECQATLSFVLN